MSALICGSMAFDTIMVFEDHFKNHILADQVHILNVAFLVPEMRREFGGCAGNIAYNLHLLGETPLPMASVGADFGPYANHLDKLGICRDYLKTVPEAYTAQAFITTDLDDNQITAFHPGAMDHSHENHVNDARGARLGIVAPDGRDGMLQHAAQFAEAGIPFIFDPGQGLPMFDGETLTRFIDQAEWVVVNDYESRMLQDRTGLEASQIAERLEAYIVTRGGKGAVIHRSKRRTVIPAVQADKLEDPTGCGDAFRAGLLFGALREMDLETSARIASLLGSIKIGHHGTQNHSFSLDQFEARFSEAWGYSFQ